MVCGRGAGIAGADVDLGRRDVGILLDRQREDRAEPGEHDDDRDDPGEDRPIDEDPRHRPLAAAAPRPPAGRAAGLAAAPSFAARSAGTGRIGAPVLRLAVPWVIDLVAGVEPAGHHPVGAEGAVGDDACAARPCCPARRRTRTPRPPMSRWSAGCGTRNALGSTAWVKTRLDEHAGQQQCPADWGTARAGSRCRCFGRRSSRRTGRCR